MKAQCLLLKVNQSSTFVGFKQHIKNRLRPIVSAIFLEVLADTTRLIVAEIR